jgi:hypothetical protein
MREITIRVSGYPPAKNAAKSILAVGHVHAEGVLALLRAANDATRFGDTAIYFPDESLGLELIVTSPAPPPSDAANYLGGVADVLEDKQHRGDLPHLGEPAGFALYPGFRS